MTIPPSISFLIVDDDRDDSFLLVKQLQKMPLEALITQIHNGREAMDFLCREETPPSVIFLDLVLPGMTGLEILERVRSDPRLSKVPVVVTTGSLDPKKEDLCIRLGISAFLDKPITFKTVVYTVASILPNQHLA